MKLTKENVCVFIESEAHLEEARQLLEKYGEYEWENHSAFDMRTTKHLCYDPVADDWLVSFKQDRIEITLTELEQILIEERK